MIIVAIYDKGISQFNHPRTVQARGEAIRSFSDAAMDETTMINKHPEDFLLFQIGSFDPETGTIIPQDPDKICSGLDFVVKNENTETK